MKRVVITLMVNDGVTEGYAAVGELSGDTWEGIVADGYSLPDAEQSFTADLHEGAELVDTKTISPETAAALLGKPASELASIGRQRLAELDDEAASFMTSHSEDEADERAEVEPIDYGFTVGDPVFHVKDYSEVGYVTELDSDYDHGGVTTCRVVWGATDYEDAKSTPQADQDIQWTNKLVLATPEEIEALRGGAVLKGPADV